MSKKHSCSIPSITMQSMKLMCLPSNRFLNFLRGCVSLKKTINFYWLRNRTLCSCLKSFKSSDLFVTLRCSLGTCLLSPANVAFTFAVLPWDLAFFHPHPHGTWLSLFKCSGTRDGARIGYLCQRLTSKR